MIDNKSCFIIMPFGQQGTVEQERNLSIYRKMIKPVVDSCGYEAIRADEIEYPGSITRSIIEYLHRSDLVVSDLSGRNANVFYELGIRHALYRAGTILICRLGEELPFDIKDYRVLFYSIELEGPEQFRDELQRRIKAFEKFQQSTSDNPVYDILGDKLLIPDLENYVSLTKHKEALKRYEAITRENDRLKAELEKRIQELEENKKFKCESSKTTLPIQLRSEPIENLSEDKVKKMLKDRGFFSTGELDMPENKQGKGLNHQYEVVEKKGKKLVIDHTTGLIWQQSGSPNYMEYADAEKYIKQLNDNRFAGYNDWRLPTLEEAMSLMETEKKNSNVYIDGVFDWSQSCIWTADKESSSAVWVVGFLSGGCHKAPCGHLDGHVRAVR